MLYGIPGTDDPATAYAAAVTYWVFSCRDLNRSPAKGLDTWSFLQTSIQNAAIPAKTIDQYCEHLCGKLVVPALYPKRFAGMLGNPANEKAIWIGDRQGNELQLLTPELSATGIFVSPGELLRDLARQGIEERRIVSLCKPVRFGGIPHVIAMYCQAANELYRFKPGAEEESIEVMAHGL